MRKKKSASASMEVTTSSLSELSIGSLPVSQHEGSSHGPHLGSPHGPHMSSTHVPHMGNPLHPLSEHLSQPNEDEAVVRAGLAMLRSWIHSNRHAVTCRQDANFLLRFLRMKKFCLRETLTVLQKYLQMRQDEPHIFNNLDVYDPPLEDLVNRGYMFVLPERDSHGRRVIVSRGSRIDPARHTPDQVFRLNVMTFETLLLNEENQSRGFSYLFDQKSIGFSHVFMWTPSQVTHMVSTCESALPMRHQQMNFVNMGMLMHTVLEFVKNLLSKKLQARFVVHRSMESLHQMLPAKILPKEYGGQTPLQDMIDSWKQELLSARPSVLSLDQLSLRSDNLTSLLPLEMPQLCGDLEDNITCGTSTCPSAGVAEPLAAVN